MIFAALLLLIQVPIVTESLRLGRQTEIRLRMALLQKMPRLVDRYFQSRPISDMADRGHGIHITRQLPGLAVLLIQGLFELLATLAGTILIDPQGALLAIALVVAALGIPVAAQSMVGERDLRVRNHSAALGDLLWTRCSAWCRCAHIGPSARCDASMKAFSSNGRAPFVVGSLR